MSQTIGQTKLAYSRVWHHIDVGRDPRALGRIASQIAIVLMGKHKPIWDPSTDCGDYVVATNCHELHTTGKKRFQKKYYKASTRPGSLKEITMDRMFAKWGGAEVLRRAVNGMLPKNRLRDDRLARLKAFEGIRHPYIENIVKFKDKSGIKGIPSVVEELSDSHKENSILAEALAKPKEKIIEAT